MATLACWTQADSPRGPDAQPTLRPPEGNQALCNPGWSLLFKHPYLLVVPGELTSGSPNLLPMAFVWMEIQNSYTHVYDINLRVHMHHVLARRLATAYDPISRGRLWSIVALHVERSMAMGMGAGAGA
eukprot:1143173-Pelagomonas_calceolata.AAC.2